MVLDAVDLGYRVVLVRDAVCSTSNEGHDALLKVYHGRYSIQIETEDAEQILRYPCHNYRCPQYLSLRRQGYGG
jgi:nicotinamidase-related amidase